MHRFAVSLGLTFALMTGVGFAGSQSSADSDGKAAEGTTPSPVFAPTPITTSPRPLVATEGTTPDRQHTLDEALESFRSNGLELPDLDVRFFDDDTECKGHYGLIQRQFDPWRILICSELPWVLTHELAHGWESSNLTDVDRDRFVEAGGFETWSDHDYPWNDRAIEIAAFTIQQNLMATSPRLESRSWQKRLADYQLLTGQASPLLSPL